MPAGADERRAAFRNRANDRAVPSQLRRNADGAGRAAGAGSESPGQRFHRDCRRHGHEHPAPQPQRDLYRPHQVARQPGSQQRAALSLRQGTGLSDRRADAEFVGGAQADLQDRDRRGAHPCHVGRGTGYPRRKDDLHHQRALHRQQVDAGRAHCGSGIEPQAAAARRRQGFVNGRCPHRPRAEERLRRKNGDGGTCSSTRRCRPASSST